MEQNKNVHKIHKRCKIFVKRLASKFQKDLPASRLKNSHLESAFRDTVDSLPKESLREKLLTNFDKYAKLLQKYCDVNRDKEETDEVISSYSDIEFPYNLYLKDGHIISDKVPESEKDVLCCHVLAKKLERDCVSRGGKRIFEKLEEEASALSGSYSEVEGGLRMIRLCTGIKNPQVILAVMKMCLSKFQSSSEGCILKGKAKQARALSAKVQQFLMICHVRYHSIQQMPSDKGPHYEDLMAAYLSIYIDLCLVVANKEENHESLSKRVCSFTAYLLSQWPHHMLDVLLQLTCLESENADVVLPLIRKAFQHKPDPGNNKQYLKYILIVRTLTQKLDSKMEEIKQETLGIKAPKDFLSWLQEEKPEVLEEMPEDRKFKGRQITRFLLEDMSEDLESQLMDLLTDDSSVDEEKIEEIDDQEITVQSKQKSDKPVHAPTGPSLFYFDTKGTGTNDQQTEQGVKDDVESTDDVVILDDEVAIDDDDDDDVQKEENGVTDDNDDDSEDNDDITGTFFIDKKSNDDIEMVDDSDVEVTSVVLDTINQVQETLKNVRMTRHARKLFETSKLDSKSPRKTKEVESPLNQNNTLKCESTPVDTEQTTKRRASVKLSPKKSPLKSGVSAAFVEESIVIPDSDIEEMGDNLKFDFVPEISSHLKQTPHGKKMTENQKTPISRKIQKNYDNIDQSDDEKVESEDLMSPVISLVRVEPSKKMIQSMKTGLSQTTRLRTRSLTEMDSDKLGSDKKASKLSNRKSLSGCKPVVMDESLQLETIAEINMTRNNSETVNAEHDVVVGGYSLRQTRKRTLSEASNSSVMSRQSVTEKPDKTMKSASTTKTPKSKNITRIDDVVLIEMSDSEASSPTKKSKKKPKTRINDVDLTEMSDSEGLGPDDVEEDTTEKTLFKVDKEIAFSIEKTKDKKDPNRRKSEPGNRKLTAIKDLKSTKSRRYSLRQK